MPPDMAVDREFQADSALSHGSAGITSFSFEGFNLDAGAVRIDPKNRTVVVTVPAGTDLTADLTPVIAHNGKTIVPTPAARRFYSGTAYAPAVYTVTAANGSRSIWTVMVRLAPLPAGTDVRNWLSKVSGGKSAAAPVLLPVSIDFSTGWAGLLSAVTGAGKYVALDLSACAMPAGSTEFDPGTYSAGKDKIVSLVLPDAAKSIAKGFVTKVGVSDQAGDSPPETPGPPLGGPGAFEGFTSLTSVEGVNIASVGEYAFAGCGALKMLSLPAATGIGNGSFDGCIVMETLSLPAAASIGIDSCQKNSHLDVKSGILRVFCGIYRKAVCNDVCILCNFVRVCFDSQAGEAKSKTCEYLALEASRERRRDTVNLVSSGEGLQPAGRYGVYHKQIVITDAAGQPAPNVRQTRPPGP